MGLKEVMAVTGQPSADCIIMYHPSAGKSQLKNVLRSIPLWSCAAAGSRPSGAACRPNFFQGLIPRGDDCLPMGKLWKVDLSSTVLVGVPGKLSHFPVRYIGYVYIYTCIPIIF